MARGNGGLGFQGSFEGCKDVRLSVQAQVALIRDDSCTYLSPLPTALGLLVRDSKHSTVNVKQQHGVGHLLGYTGFSI